MNDDITPDEVLATFWRWWKVWLTAILILAALILGRWRAGWWFAGQNVNRQTQIIQNSNSNQTALVQQVDTQIGNVLTATVQMDGVAKDSQQYADLHAQRLGFARLACADAAQVTIHMPASQVAWVAANCLAGTLNPASPLYK